MAKYEDNIITYYSMKKLNKLELLNGDILKIDYVKEDEFNKNYADLELLKNHEFVNILI